MTLLTRRGRRFALTAAGCVVAAAAVVVGTSLTRHSAADVTRGDVRIVQLNLCDSGIARCYTGRSVSEAAAVLRSERPDVVTLNEVCRDDVSTLKRMLASTGSGGVVAAFRPAVDRHGGGAVRCRNGQEYGDGVLTRTATPGAATYGGTFPMQDGRDVEKRVWLCVRAETYACTTHLASTSPATAFAQCRYLLHTAIPALLRQHGTAPVLLGGDLNLTSGGSPDANSCAPGGYTHADDGARQHVLAGGGIRVTASTTIDMYGTTDHPALRVDLARG